MLKEEGQINRAYRVLSACNRAVVRAANEQALLQEICRILIAEGDYRLAWIGIAEQDQAKTVRPVAQAGYEDGYLDTVNITWADTERGRGPTGTAIRTGKPGITQNMLTNAGYAPWRAEAIRRGYAASIALPLYTANQILGALNIYAVEPNAFDSNEVELLMQLAGDLAYGISALRLKHSHEQAVESLRQTQQQYQDLYENAPNAYFSTGTDGHILKCNNKAGELLGYAVEELAGQPILEFYADTPFGKEKARQIFGNFQKGHTTVDRELQMLRADGKLLWVSLTVNPVTDSAGHIQEIRAMVVDITQRKQTEEQIRHLSQAVEQSPVSVVITNTGGTIEYVNPRFCQITGYTFEEVVGENPRILKSGEMSTEEYTRMWNTITSGRRWRGEFRNIKKNGDYYWEMASISPVRNADGEITHFIGIKEDITRRKWVENALQQSEERFRQVVVSISDHIYVTEIDEPDKATNLYISPNVEQLTGYPQEKFLADWSFWGLSVIHPDDRAAAAQMARLRKGNSSEAEYRLIRADGETIWVRDSARVEQARQKKTVYGVASNITDRKLAEHHLERELAVNTALAELYEPVIKPGSSIQTIANTVLEWAQHLTTSEHGFVSEVDPETGDNVGHTLTEMLKGQCQVEGENRYIAFPRGPNGKYGGLWGYALNTRQGFYTNTPRSHPSATGIPEGHLSIDAFLTVPVLLNQEVVGQIALSNPTRHYIDDDLNTIQRIAEFYALALQRKRAETEIRTLTEELEQRVADRTRELSALYEITSIGSKPDNLHKILKRMLERILEAVAGSSGCIHLVDEEAGHLQLAAQQQIPPHVAALLEKLPFTDATAGRILKHNEPLLIPDVEGAPLAPLGSRGNGLHTFVGVPMRAGGHTVGILSVMGQAVQQFNVEEISLLMSGADQVAVVVENVRLQQRAEKAAVMEERERLARELHDSVTQSLYSLALFAEAGQELADLPDREAVKHNFTRIGETAQDALKEMRLLVHELRPLDLAHEGLAGALHRRLGAVEQRVNIKARLVVADDLLELPLPIEEGLYRVAQEALNNVLKHADATSVTVYLRRKGNAVTLKIADDGIGIAPESTANSGGLGLTGMRERVEKMGGQISIVSEPKQGTHVTVTINTE